MGKEYVGEVIADSLRDLDVNVVFGIPGTHIYHVYWAIEEREDINLIVARHENNAVFMADVYGRLSGKPGVSVVTAGPGLTNSLTGIAQAFSSSSPVLVISGDVPLGNFYDFHGVDEPNILDAVSSHLSKDTYLLSDPDNVENIVKSGYLTAYNGRKGPVHISIPRNILFMKGEYNGFHSSYKECDEMSIKKNFLEKYLKGKIAVVLGPEFAYPEYREEILRLIESLASPLISETSALGFIPQSNKLFAGFYEKNFVIYSAAKKIIEESDTILFMGVRPESIDTISILKNVKKNVNLLFLLPSINSKDFLLNLETECIIEFFNIDSHKAVIISGPIKKIIEPLLDAGISSKEFIEDWRATIKARYNEIIESIKKYSSMKPIYQGYAIYILTQYIPQNANLLVDVGGNELWSRYLIAPIYPLRYLYAGAYGSLGFSFGGAIGSKIAEPYKETISLTGDGSLLMSLMELQTLKYYNIPVKIIVLNDRSYGILSYFSKRELPKEISSDIGKADFYKIAEAFGLEGIKIENAEKLDSEFKDVFKSPNKSILIDIKTSKEFPSFFP